MRQGPGLIWICVFVFSASFLFTPQSLNAQATPAAFKQGEISIYGAYSRVSTDYGAQKDNGAIFGAEYTHFMNWFLTPSLELRGKVVTGPNVNQRTWGGGVRGGHRFRHFYPYMDFLVSAGTIQFNHPFIDFRGKPYSSDNSIVYSAGGGVDYDVSRHFAARFDYQFEHWNLGSVQSLTPEALSIGVAYHLSSHSRE
jgi:opacity protein-like surface antigen